jgi:hypothetical protein
MIWTVWKAVVIPFGNGLAINTFNSNSGLDFQKAWYFPGKWGVKVNKYDN